MESVGVNVIQHSQPNSGTQKLRGHKLNGVYDKAPYSKKALNKWGINWGYVYMSLGRYKIIGRKFNVTPFFLFLYCWY
jgi:hypothetical protein